MITIWHNPRCSKSRQALALLEEAGCTPTIRRYLDDPPDAAELAAAREALGAASFQSMIRKGEQVYKDLNLGPDSPDADLLAAVVRHPILIERPLVFRGDRAVIGRPPGAIKALL